MYLIMKIWNDKRYIKIALSKNLTPTARELWQWLLSDMKPDQSEIEFDLKKFNTWVAKQRGKPHDPKTIKRAAQQLMDSGIVSYFKRFTWSVWRWVIKPIDFLVEACVPQKRKKSLPEGQIPETQPSNPCTVENEYPTTATVSLSSGDPQFGEKLEACQKAGIYYEPKDAKFLAGFPLEKVLASIVYFLQHRENVYKPEGWFRVCLEEDWVGQEQERHVLRTKWSTENLFEAIHHCNQMMQASQSQ